MDGVTQFIPDPEAWDVKLIVEYLEKLPTGQEIKWSSAHIDEMGLGFGWIDIYMTQDNPLPLPEMGWIWTVDTPAIDGDVSGTNFKLQPNVILTKDYEIVTERPISWEGLSPGWTTERLSEGLREWSEVHAKRTDLTFCWVPFSYLELDEIEEDEEISNGSESPTFYSGEDLGELLSEEMKEEIEEDVKKIRQRSKIYAQRSVEIMQEMFT